MNRVYNLIWNRALLTLQAVSELAGTSGDDTAGRVPMPLRKNPLAFACLAALAMTTFAAPVWAQTTLVNASWGSTSGGKWATASKWQCTTPAESGAFSCVPADGSGNIYQVRVAPTSNAKVAFNSNAYPTTIDSLLVGGHATLHDDTAASGYKRFLTIGDPTSSFDHSGELQVQGKLSWGHGDQLTVGSIEAKTEKL